MKIYKYITTIAHLLLFLGNFNSNAQNQQLRYFDDFDDKNRFHDEFLIDDGLLDIYSDLYNPRSFTEVGNFNFGNFNFGAINAGLLYEAQKRDALLAWYEKQRVLIKSSIEKYYGHNFSTYTKAVDATLIDYGKSNYKLFDNNVSSLKSNKLNTNKVYKAKNKVNLTEIQQLNHRKQEIIDGNINNSVFTFSEIYGGTLLKDIKDLNTLNKNWAIINGFLNFNLPTEQNAKYFYQELNNLDDKFDSFLLGAQRKFYNNELNPGQKLFLEQFSINLLAAYRVNPSAFSAPKADINLNIPAGLDKSLLVPVGNKNLLQNYLWKYSKKSVFDPNYYLEVLDEILVNNGKQKVYGDISKITWAIRMVYVNIAKAQAKERRDKAFNDLINSSNTEDVLIDLAITALGAKSNNFLNSKPNLRKEIKRYLSINKLSTHSKNAINYLLKQYLDNKDFDVNSNLYQSASTPLFQDASNPNRALQFNFKPQAITEGITGFGNVLAELLKDNENPDFEGFIIKNMFIINGINLSNNLTNSILGSYYRFIKNNGSSISIHFEGNLGSYLFNLDVNNINFLNNLGIGEAETFLNHLKLFQNTPIKFSKLWENYENIEGTHIKNENKEDFENYCAINLSNALLNTGVPSNKLRGVRCWGCQNILNRNKHVIRAEELGKHLIANFSEIDGLSAPKFLTGDNFEDYIDDKKGIVYFENYWKRKNETEANRSGDHIDLWDGNELAGSSWFWSRFRLNLPWIAERFGSTDLRKSKRVVFWEIKD